MANKKKRLSTRAEKEIAWAERQARKNANRRYEPVTSLEELEASNAEAAAEVAAAEAAEAAAKAKAAHAGEAPSAEVTVSSQDSSVSEGSVDELFMDSLFGAGGALSDDLQTSEPVPPPTASVHKTATRDEPRKRFEDMTVPELKDQCRENGLKVGGLKSELLARLNNHVHGQ